MRQEELLEREPALSTAARAGFLLPQERHVEPLSFVRRILAGRRGLPAHAGKGYSFSVPLQPAPLRPIMFGDARVGISPFTDCVRIVGTMEFSGDDLRLDSRRLKALAKAGSPSLEDAGCYRSDLNGYVAPD